MIYPRTLELNLERLLWFPVAQELTECGHRTSSTFLSPGNLAEVHFLGSPSFIPTESESLGWDSAICFN